MFEVALVPVETSTLKLDGTVAVLIVAINVSCNSDIVSSSTGTSKSTKLAPEAILTLVFAILVV